MHCSATAAPPSDWLGARDGRRGTGTKRTRKTPKEAKIDIAYNRGCPTSRRRGLGDILGVVGDGEDDEYNDEPDDDDAEKLPRHQNFHVAELLDPQL